METLMQIEKNVEAGVPEAMRVVFNGRMYLVQMFSEFTKTWNTVAEWKNARYALVDCSNYYLATV